MMLALVSSDPPPGLLAGPAVTDVADDERDARFGIAAGDRRKRDVSPRQWFVVLDRLDLSRLQRTDVKTLRREFQQARRSHLDEYGTRLRELRRTVRAAREAGEKPSLEVLLELDHLEAFTPRVEELQLRIWALLDDDQQQRMRVALAEHRETEAAAALDDSTQPDDLDERARRRLKARRRAGDP